MDQPTYCHVRSTKKLADFRHGQALPIMKDDYLQLIHRKVFHGRSDLQGEFAELDILNWGSFLTDKARAWKIQASDPRSTVHD